MSKKLIIIGLVLVSFFGCKKDVKINYFYSNGSTIDTNYNILSLEKETKKIVSNLKINHDELNAYTSLNHKFKISLKKNYDTLFSIISKQFPKHKKYIDSLYENVKLFELGILVIENNTGNIEFDYSYPKGTDQINMKYPLGAMFKSFEYTLAMEKEYKPDDFYPLTTHKIGDSSLIEVPDTSSKMTFFYPFWGALPAPINPLFKRYERKDFVKLLDKMNCIYDTIGVSHYYRWQLSLYDVTKAHTIFKNQGNFIKPHYIDSLTDKNDVTVYRNNFEFEEVLSKTTAQEMMSLLEYYINRGVGRSVRWKHKYLKPLAGRSAEAPLKTFWFVGISDDITIGIRFNFNLDRNEFRYMRDLRNQNITIPIWHETRQMIKH